MKTILISEFKAKCIAVLSEAQRTREPVMVTRRGKPMAKIEPVCEDDPSTRNLARGREIPMEADRFFDDWEC